jgi:hypothetical protein
VPFGASRNRQEVHPPETADALADLVLTDAASGEDVRLGDLWVQRPAVLAWLRHYG